MSENERQDDVLRLMSGRKGHFKLESGHHGDLWLDLDQFLLDARLAQQLSVDLAGYLARLGVEAVGGPLVGGALVAQSIAAELDVPFYYAERVADAEIGGLYASRYAIPGSLRAYLRGKQVAVVDDVINAGSAVRATIAELEACGAQVIAIGALIVLGEAAARLFAPRATPLLSLARLPNELWAPERCPLCARGVPLEDLVGT